MPLQLHPALKLALALVMLLLIQLDRGGWLVLGLVPLALFGGAGPDFRRLLRRTRWLLLSLVLVFALGTPGTMWYPPLGLWVTREGGLLAVEHSARLVAVLAVVASLLARTPPQSLAAGLLTLLAPLARLGVPVNRAVARLVLVLRNLDQASTPARTGVGGTWRFSLAALMGTEPVARDASSPDVLEIPMRPLTRGERLLLCLAGAGALGVLVMLVGGGA